jgi:phenylacetate-CoA ligase
MDHKTNITFQSAAEIKEYQQTKLKELLVYLQNNSPYYKQFFAENNIDISAIHTLEDISSLPTTGKDELQTRNEDFLCVPKNKIIEYTSTSGTIGKPVTIALSDNDLNRLAYNEYSSFLCADGSASDIYQLMLTLDRQFMAGMAYYTGIRKIGAGIIRVGPGVPSLQWETIARLQPTAIVAVPSFIVKLMQFAEEHKIDINNSSVKKAICIGENIRNTDFSLNVLGKKITSAWNIKLYSTYASTEMQTAFTECIAQHGGHLQPDLLIVELLDDHGNVVTAGSPGEVTITTLGLEAMPLLRYKTGDICIAHHEPCSCGRNTLRLSPVIGRKKQMIKYKGTTLFLPALSDILNEMEDIHEYVVEVYANDLGTDEILLHLVGANNTEETDHKIRAYLQARLRVSPHVKYVSKEQMMQLQFPDAGRKPRKFIDKR